jgi:hypothetical protein
MFIREYARDVALEGWPEPHQWFDRDRFVRASLPPVREAHLAASVPEALNGVVALVADVVDDMSKSNETPPQPLSLQDFKGKIAVRVPPQLHRELATEAAEQGVSLNRLISQKLAR